MIGLPNISLGFYSNLALLIKTSKNKGHIYYYVFWFVPKTIRILQINLQSALTPIKSNRHGLYRNAHGCYNHFTIPMKSQYVYKLGF